MVRKPPGRFAFLAILGLAAASGIAFLAMTDWSHPFRYLGGVKGARRDIEDGTARFLEIGCIPEIGRVDDATGLPFLTTGLLSPEGEAEFRGYMHEIERARREGRLGACSVRGKILSREAALAEFERGPRTRLVPGGPAVSSPDGRYRVRAEIYPRGGNPFRPTFDVILSDGRLSSERYIACMIGVNDPKPVEVVPGSGWQYLLLREGDYLRIIDLPRGLPLRDFDDAWPGGGSPSPGAGGEGR